MLKNKFKTISLILILCSFFILPASTFSQSNTSNTTDNDAAIQALQEEINQKQQRLEELKDRENEYKKQIQTKQDEQASLKNQISILNDNINKTEIQLQSTQINVDKTDLEIKKVTLEIAEKEESIAQNKKYLQSLLKLIAQNDNKDALEILLVNNSLSEFLDQVQYLKNLNGNIQSILEKVKEVKVELEEQQDGLEKKKKELEELKKKLAEQKAEIGDQKVNKQYILDKTKQSEQEYQKLLSAAKAEQDSANASIVSAEKAIRARLLEKEGKDALTFNEGGFVWPVPKNVITAYFHDPDYPYRNVFEHPAVDIRAAQSTAIRAAASGYVAQAKDNGYGYSYIMVVHGDGLATVYGHVSRIDVKVDQFVVQGQVIGLSGGMPGTKGAGYMTTGPHLHFETRLNGIPVNPLNYLP